jgi:hypothetical protein
MRLCTIALLWLALASGASKAQSPTRAAPAVPDAAGTALLRGKLSLVRMATERTLPPTSAFVRGPLTIPAGTTVDSSLAVAWGTVTVAGQVTGSVTVVDGDIVLQPGASVAGNAVSIGGQVVADPLATVGGETAALTALGRIRSDEAAAPPRSVRGRMVLVLGWCAVLALIGLGVLIFAESSLDGAVLALERSVGRSFAAGLLGQLALLPALLLLCVALAVTVLGVLLIPFAVVAYTIAAAGLVTLGFLAVARVVGTGPAVRGAPAGVAVRATMWGLVMFGGLWLVAAAVGDLPVAGWIARVAAAAITWAMVTAGLGAAILSRAGTIRLRTTRTAAPGGDEMAWRTPTPITGVPAARRQPSRTSSSTSSTSSTS